MTGDCAAVTSVLGAAGLKTNCGHQNSTSVAQGTVIDWNPKGQAILGSTVTVIVSAGPPIETIPSLTGSTCAGATTTLQALGLQITCTNQYSDTVPNGQVVSWSPTGTALAGRDRRRPGLAGAGTGGGARRHRGPVSAALAALQNAGLAVGNISGPGSGRVVATSPTAGTSVSKGTTVNLTMQ